VARIVLPEAISAITQRRNERKVDRHGVLQLWSSVLADFSGTASRYEVVELTEAVVLRAALLAATHGLRGYDAVQLATALSVQMRLEDPAALVFVSSDGALTRAAKAAGLATADPTV
jgi:predicted nucleic acid-binding protein